YSSGGRKPGEGYPTLPMPTAERSAEFDELCVVANYAEVTLAREGHSNPVGINYLEKVQIPHLPSLYGAMLAGVSVVLMGAGIPLRIPGALDRFALHQRAEYPLRVTGDSTGHETLMSFDPRDIIRSEVDGNDVPPDLPPLQRPRFFP